VWSFAELSTVSRRGATSASRSSAMSAIAGAGPEVPQPVPVCPRAGTQRVAISNRRLRFAGDGKVRFTYRDYAAHAQDKELTLPAPEFLLYVVPRGFMRNCQRGHQLRRCRELFGIGKAAQTHTDPAPPTAEAGALRRTRPSPRPRSVRTVVGACASSPSSRPLATMRSDQAQAERLKNAAA